MHAKCDEWDLDTPDLITIAVTQYWQDNYDISLEQFIKYFQFFRKWRQFVALNTGSVDAILKQLMIYYLSQKRLPAEYKINV